MDQDRRRYKRHILLTEVTIEGASGGAESRISDISPEGVFIDTISPLPIGASVNLKFTLPTGHLVSAEGVVIHCLEGIGMGIAFSEIGAEDVLLIRDCIE